KTLAVTDGTHASSGTGGAGLGLTVTAGASDRLVITPASNTITAAATETYTAVGYDQYGNLIGDVTAPTTFPIRSGASFVTNSVPVTTPGTTLVVTAADGSASGTTYLTVTPAAASGYRITGGSSLTAGGTETITVTQVDQYQNVEIGLSGSVSL